MRGDGGDDGAARLAPELRVFDYIYGVLHSPDYRVRYAQFLKIDFPRIPYPASPEIFAAVADMGGQLRALHLMDDAAVGDTPYPFIGVGDGVVVKPEFVVAALAAEGATPTPLASRDTPSPQGGGEDAAPSPLRGGRLSVAERGGGAVGRVQINAEQYFDNVPEIAWSFHIGGYQPAQKWLKDRRGRALGFDDVRHYQKIIKILAETDRIMREIVLPLG